MVFCGCENKHIRFFYLKHRVYRPEQPGDDGATDKAQDGTKCIAPSHYLLYYNLLIFYHGLFD